MNSTVRNDYLTLLKDGVAQLNASLPDIALEHFDRALRSGCNLSCLHHARAVALMQLGRNNEAAQAYRAEIAASPEKINNYNINKADDNLAIQIN
jgi:Flp pilus assembly protein TadD